MLSVTLKRRWWILLAGVALAVVLGAAFAGAWVYWEQREDDEARRAAERRAEAIAGCEFANDLLRAIDRNGQIAREHLELDAQDRREAAIAALHDGAYDDAARRSAAAREYTTLAESVEEIQTFDCEGGERP